MYHHSLVDLLLFSAVAEESCLTRGARKAHLAVPADHPLKDREIVDFSEALEYEFVTLDRNFAMQKFLYEKADEIGRVLKSRLEVEDPLILLRLVSEGLGIGVLSRKAFTSLSAYAKAVPVRLSNP